MMMLKNLSNYMAKIIHLYSHRHCPFGRLCFIRNMSGD